MIACVHSMLVHTHAHSQKRSDSIAAAHFSWKQKGVFKIEKVRQIYIHEKKMGNKKTKGEQGNVTILE